MTMNEPRRQFRLTGDEIVAIQRNGTLQTDLDIVEWMERSVPHGEYRCSADAFVVSTPDGDLPAGTDDWVVRFADGRFLPCMDLVFSAITRVVPEAPLPSLCSACCDPVPPAELHLLASDTRLCTDCLLEYQLLLEVPDLSEEMDRKPAPQSTPQEARR